MELASSYNIVYTTCISWFSDANMSSTPPKNPLDRSYNQNKYEAEMGEAWERPGEVLVTSQSAAGV